LASQRWVSSAFERVSTDMIDFVPAVGGWASSYLALHEWIGCAWYVLRQWVRSGN